ncbi:MAG: prolyl oligopeptidase family serine peptidase [Bacteroidales bacterium]|jgi:prolyl oligopeptidase|nr:prolyl oligopeptidase family serine peptidase [Bacteroidales bacterium]
MKKVFIVAGFIVIMSVTNGQSMKWKYPTTKMSHQKDVYFGDTVADPYRWLENDTATDTKEWVKEQNKLTFSYLEQIPFRNELKKYLTKVWDYPKYGTPFKKGKHYFFFKNDGLQNQSVLYIQQGLAGKAEVLLDPNKLSTDGTVALTGLSFSKDGNYMAYQTAKSGSDWNEIFVIDIQTRKKMSDHIHWCKFSTAAWLGNEGFFYSTYDRPEKGMEYSAKNEYHKVYFHRLGTSETEDKLMYEDPENPLLSFNFDTDEAGNYIYLTVSGGEEFGNQLFIKSVKDKSANFEAIYAKMGYDFYPIDIVGGKILVMTNYNAPNYQVLSVDPTKPQENNWQILIPQTDDVLNSVSLAGGKIFLSYLHDVKSKVIVCDTTGKKINELQLPTIGTVSSFSAKKDDNIAFFAFSSYAFPTTIYKYNTDKNTTEVFHAPQIQFDPNLYETKQVFFKSLDGTKIPMFITARKGIQLDGNNPLLLYGYGGFNISLTPSFSVSNLPFLNNGGIYVVVNLRGGGEYGHKWHELGTKMQKQNVFNDFIAAAEYLIKEKYTSSEKLAILGGSNGGLLVGACMTQRPDLFKVCLPQVGVLDMLRYHKFTIGWAWASDYGTSEESKEMYSYLKNYSPLHNVKKGATYPATLVFTADHDDRVVPAHSFKFISTLQANDSGKNPLLIRIDTDAGHGAGKPTSKSIEETADRWAFIMYHLGMTPKL